MKCTCIFRTHTCGKIFYTGITFGSFLAYFIFYFSFYFRIVMYLVGYASRYKVSREHKEHNEWRNGQPGYRKFWHMATSRSCREGGMKNWHTYYSFGAPQSIFPVRKKKIYPPLVYTEHTLLQNSFYSLFHYRENEKQSVGLVQKGSSCTHRFLKQKRPSYTLVSCRYSIPWEI